MNIEFPYRPCPRCNNLDGVWYRRAWRCYRCWTRLELKVAPKARAKRDATDD